MLTKTTRHSRAFSLLEFMMTFMILCMLSSIAMALLHTGSRISMQAHCVSNLRTIWTMTKAYKLDHRVYPPEYPEASLSELYGSYGLPPQTFKCLEFEAEEGVNEVAVDDVYSPFYVAPREQAEKDLPICVCPYHENYGETVVVTSQGRATSADSVSLLYTTRRTRRSLTQAERATNISLVTVEPSTVFTGGTLYLWDRGRILIDSRFSARLIANYEDHGVRCLVVKALEGQEGGMNIELPESTRMVVVSEAGMIVLEATEVSGYFEVSIDQESSGAEGTVLVECGEVHLYGRNLSQSN